MLPVTTISARVGGVGDFFVDELVGDFGMDHVVDAGTATTTVGGAHFDELEVCDLFEDLARLEADFLSVCEMAGVLVGDAGGRWQRGLGAVGAFSHRQPLSQGERGGRGCGQRRGRD